jgi:hypothetical protein
VDWFDSNTLRQIYRGLEKRYLESLISSSWWFDSITRNQTGPIVYRLEFRPVTAGGRVRFSLGPPKIIVRWPSGPRQVTANLYNRGFESHPHFQQLPPDVNGSMSVSKTDRRSSNLWGVAKLR